MTERPRLRTGIAGLDELLGGGLLPGTLTVVLGATGIGKTQLGLQFAQAGRRQEGESGILFDMTARGDAQSHHEYARRLCGWTLRDFAADEKLEPEAVWQRERIRSDYAHIFERSGRRPAVGEMDADEWREWKLELTKKLDRTIAFFYGNFVHGVRRCVIDGVEPVEKAADSFQFHMVEYVYHQILRKEADWVARDLFRVKFRANEETVREHAYDSNEVGCLLLATSTEVMLDDLLSRPLETGDLLSNANTVILMGKIRDGTKMRRALHVAKHRGSACSEEIVPFEIGENGLRLQPESD